MNKDHKTEVKRREAQARYQAKSGKPRPQQIDPERLHKAIRYLREHPAPIVQTRAPAKPGEAPS
jgi:hypothetical protein